MTRSLPIFGLLVGLLMAMVVADRLPRRADSVDRPDAILPEVGAPLREIVIQYIAGDRTALPVYQSFLPQLSGDVTVDVLCQDRAAFDELKCLFGDISCTMRPIVTGHEITVWSRDRWLATRPRDANSPITLIAPGAEDGQESWPARSGDAMVAFDLARSLNGAVSAQRLPILFDAGDFLAADERTVFVTPAVLKKNLQRTVGSREELLDLLAKHFMQRMVLLDQAPHHHAGMYMMAVGERTILVGDPSLGKPFITTRLPTIPDGPDLSKETQELFDAVASQVQREGFHVVRIPTVVSPDQKTYLTYVNVITEERDGREVVYLPVYRGAETLNESASQVWRDLGYEVHPVDCTSSYRSFGNLHCLVNVIHRGS